jgi:polyhydroxyalkanoate synthesis repressor PhaR
LSSPEAGPGDGGTSMTASEKKPITIKKYANRRLYNTGTSTYVTLEDLAAMVKVGEDFAVFDAKTGEEITRSVLAQIIFEQEGKNGQSLLPTAFLRQLIRFYGDSMQMLVPSYLEFTIDKLTNDQHKMREQVENAMSSNILPSTVFHTQIFDQLEEQTRKNMLMFSQALTLFNPFSPKPAPGASVEVEPPRPPASDDLQSLRNELSEMQKRLERLATKTPGE